ncbi:MAG: ArnT family glycosyltransferase, partial [Candidatus Binatia bacterium]
MTRTVAALLGVIVLGGLALRFAGLSHDLDAGYVYHPDTPKQIDATRRFLAGSYTFRLGHPDYDGYPYLNSHLVEYAWRAIHASANGFLGLIGAPPRRPPGRIALFWTTRILSAVVSTLAIAVVFALGRRAYGTAAGLVAALYLAVSPADVAAAHYEISDTTAAFFALVSIFFALRIYDRGRPLDSALAGLFAAAAFAAKYHAGVAIVPAVLAHLLAPARDERRRQLFGGLAMLGVALAGGLLLAIPTLATDASGTIRDILGFLRHTSTVNVPPEIEGAFPDRFLFSLWRNGPVLADIVGLEVLVAAIAGLAMPFGDWRRRLVLASLPVLYLFVLVPFRPKAPPIYHILTTPLVFLFAAALLTSAAVAVAGRARRVVRIVSAGLIVVSASFRLEYSLGEDFFFARQDT